MYRYSKLQQVHSEESQSSLEHRVMCHIICENRRRFLFLLMFEFNLRYFAGGRIAFCQWRLKRKML